MRKQIRKLISFTVGAILMLGVGMPVLAATNVNNNPATGDTMGQYLPIVIGALAVSAILIIVLLLLSKKGKKGKKRNGGRPGPRK